MAAARSLALGLLLALAACGGRDLEQEQAADPAASEQSGSEAPGPDFAKLVLPEVARSIWGVVPDPPRRKRDLRPELIEGAAVAVAPDTLLASCQVVGERQQVGVVRHNKYRLAQVAPPSQPEQDVCALHVADAPLNVVGGFRSFPDLRVGEPVYAVVSRTSAEYALAEGQLAAKGAASTSLLETTLTLPPGTLSAVLFDADGNLVGLGSGGPTVDSVVVGAPLSAALVPELAQRDLGPPTTRVAAVTVQQQPAQRRLSVWRNDQGDHESDRLLFVGTATAASVTSGATSPAAGGRTADQVADQRVNGGQSEVSANSGPSAGPAVGSRRVRQRGGRHQCWVGEPRHDQHRPRHQSRNSVGAGAGAVASVGGETSDGSASVGTTARNTTGGAGSVGSVDRGVSGGKAGSGTSGDGASSGGAANGRAKGNGGSGSDAGGGASASSGSTDAGGSDQASSRAGSDSPGGSAGGDSTGTGGNGHSSAGSNAGGGTIGQR